MPLTNEELAEADKQLTRMEKKAKTWRIERWVNLLGGLGFAGTAIFLFHYVWTGWNSEFPGVPTGKISGIDSVFLWMLNIMAIIHVSLAVRFVGYAVNNWNKGKRDYLLARLARSYVESQRSGNESPH